MVTARHYFPTVELVDIPFNVRQYRRMDFVDEDAPQNRPASPGPLSGLRVVDMTTSYAGPSGGMYLADLGADVVKIERPTFGDDARGWGPPFEATESAWFASANRNKRSAAIDVSTEQGRALLDSLLSDSDVFMQNLNPGKLKRLGLDPDTVTRLHPRLIYCGLSGWGLDGPAHNEPGYDLAAQARSGLMSVTGAKGGTPQRVSTALSDIVTGMCAALAISAAVVQQSKTGRGDVIDVSLLDSDLALMAPRIASYLAGEPEPAPSGGTDSVLAVYQTFMAADRDIAIAIGNDAMWRRFCDVVGLDELANEPQLSSNAGRRLNRERITALITGRMTTKSSKEWLELLSAANIPASVVQSLSEVVADPQVKARGNLLAVPGSERLYSVRSPFRLASVASPRNERFPNLGEHTVEVLRETGLTSTQIEELIVRGVVGVPGAEVANDEVEKDMVRG
jgi:crotonobetainyl-CoA:carnitine CoA-transferase CaiB-like acyl-CoA transferase